MKLLAVSKAVHITDMLIWTGWQTAATVNMDWLADS